MLRHAIGGGIPHAILGYASNCRYAADSRPYTPALGVCIVTDGLTVRAGMVTNLAYLAPKKLIIIINLEIKLIFVIICIFPSPPLITRGS